jgi:hypothetical protein
VHDGVPRVTRVLAASGGAQGVRTLTRMLILPNALSRQPAHPPPHAIASLTSLSGKAGSVMSPATARARPPADAISAATAAALAAGVRAEGGGVTCVDVRYDDRSAVGSEELCGCGADALAAALRRLGF